MYRQGDHKGSPLRVPRINLRRANGGDANVSPAREFGAAPENVGANPCGRPASQTSRKSIIRHTATSTAAAR